MQVQTEWKIGHIQYKQGKKGKGKSCRQKIKTFPVKMTKACRRKCKPEQNGKQGICNRNRNLIGKKKKKKERKKKHTGGK